MGLVAFGALIVGFGGAFVVLPRLAHDAFERGNFRRARRLYRVLRLYVIDRSVRAAIDVSLAGCRLAASDWGGALADLGRVVPERLAPSAKAAYLNNRAYAHARGRLDPSAALRDAEEAMALRPDVAGFRHTRALALYALGRLDEAAAELDGLWQRMGEGESSPLLEAERCYDLGLVWRDKGELDYARDYFQRARLVAPASPWSSLALAALRELPRPASSSAADTLGDALPA